MVSIVFIRIIVNLQNFKSELPKDCQYKWFFVLLQFNITARCPSNEAFDLLWLGLVRHNPRWIIQNPILGLWAKRRGYSLTTTGKGGHPFKAQLFNLNDIIGAFCNREKKLAPMWDRSCGGAEKLRHQPTCPIDWCKHLRHWIRLIVLQLSARVAAMLM